MAEELLVASESTRNRRLRSSLRGGEPIELRAGTPSRSIPAQPGDCTDSMGTDRWFESALRGAATAAAAAAAAAARSSVMNWIGKASASGGARLAVTRRHRYAPNNPSTTAPMSENDNRK